MSHPFIISFILLASASLSFSNSPQATPAKEVIISESQRLKNEKKKQQEEEHKRLSAAYDNLSDAIAANDLTTVETLFNETPRLRKYAHHREGTPLHFARSQAMVQFLIERLRFNPNICDEWGNMPSTTILATKDQFFTHPEEKNLIAHYLRSREKSVAKMYYQLRYNKYIQLAIATAALISFIGALDYYSYSIFIKKVS
jgi:hypothetical protein